MEKKKKKGKEIRLELMGLEHLKNRENRNYTTRNPSLEGVLGGISVRTLLTKAIAFLKRFPRASPNPDQENQCRTERNFKVRTGRGTQCQINPAQEYDCSQLRGVLTKMQIE